MLCAGHGDRTRCSQGFRHRGDVIRAYNSAGRIADAVLADGVNAEAPEAGSRRAPSTAG